MPDADRLWWRWGGEAGGGASPSPASPPGKGGGNPAPTTGPSGGLWHKNYAPDFIGATQVASLDNSPPTLADPEKFTRSWRDGSQYIVTEYRASDCETTITVKETSTRRTIFELICSGYATALQPSPVSKEEVPLTVSNSVTAPAEYAFINLRTRSFIDRFAESSVSVDWLPDGRYLQLATNGQLSLGTPGGSVVPAGSFNLQGRRLGNLQVNGQATQLLITLTDVSGLLAQRDLWVADIDGSNSGRLTSTNITSYGHGSPDGRQVAFNVDTGSTCTSAGCLSTCEIWYASSTARNVNPLPSSPGEASRFRVRIGGDSTATLGCELLAWLRLIRLPRNAKRRKPWGRT